MRTRALISALAAAVLLAACGGGGGTSGLPNTTPLGGGNPAIAARPLAVEFGSSASYRHGLVPMLGTPAAAVLATTPVDDLHYRGGNGGVGVTTGAPHVYLVFWGSQWGTQGTNAKGYLTFSNDTSGMAPDQQAYFAGLGSSTDHWSDVMTQYCDGVASGAITCPTTAAHIPFPTGGALAGVWEDTSAKAPGRATAHQIALEAVNAAAHFGNTTAASNLDTQYVIVSPTGTDPDSYKQSGFCAWHDYTGDSGLDGGGAVSGPGTPLAFTNMPYIPNAGASCGAGFVNPGNALDGVTIVGGHEYAETLTDQFPTGGWLANNGEETGDLCAWKTSGAGNSQDITLSTGKFAVEGTWSNLAKSCAVKGLLKT